MVPLLMTLSDLVLRLCPFSGKGKGLGTCYSAAYMSRLEQQHFTISEVAADWHELMIPWRRAGFSAIVGLSCCRRWPLAAQSGNYRYLISLPHTAPKMITGHVKNFGRFFMP